jgi:hypothetical protein
MKGSMQDGYRAAGVQSRLRERAEAAATPRERGIGPVRPSFTNSSSVAVSTWGR